MRLEKSSQPNDEAEPALHPDTSPDGSQCRAIESLPEKVSGAWVFRGTRMPVATVFENLEARATIEDIMEWFDLPREQITTILDVAARKSHRSRPALSAHSF
jgi:uncharacterized protein (DUF433 family)